MEKTCIYCMEMIDNMYIHFIHTSQPVIDYTVQSYTYLISETALVKLTHSLIIDNLKTKCLDNR